VIFLMVMQKLLGIQFVFLRRKGVWVSKILRCGTGNLWLNIYGLQGYLLICCVVEVFGRFLALETIFGVGETFLVFMVFGNVSTSVLEWEFYFTMV